MSTGEIIFELYKRSNPDEFGGDGEDVSSYKEALIKNPRFRHYEYIPPREIDSTGSVENEYEGVERNLVYPTPSPTPAPSQTTVSPTNVPSIGKSESPTNVVTTESPTNVVTSMPTMKITVSPTKSPSKQPTNGRVINNPSSTDDLFLPEIDCTIDGEGNVNGPFNGSAEADYVSYKYKIVSSGADLETEILPPLEKKLLEMLLPNVFSCEQNGRSLYDSQDRRLSMIGASSKPNDVVSTTENCAAINTDYGCDIVDGTMTFYSTDGTTDVLDLQTKTCEALNSDDLKMVHPAIMGLECVTSDVIPPITGPGPFQPSTRITAPAVIAGAAAALFVVLAAYAYRRKNKNDDDQDGSFPKLNHLDDSDVNNSNSLSQDDIPLAWTTKATYDMRSIIPTGFCPETIVENPDEDDDKDDIALDEVSLNQLSMEAYDTSNNSSNQSLNCSMYR